VKKYTLLLLIGFIQALLAGTPDSTAVSFSPLVTPRRPLIAVGEMMAANAVVWSFNRYIREDNYSFYISWRTVEANLRHGMEWDPNKFGVNFFAHPFHGSIYFNAARSNGFNFWESAPFSFAGSVMWEFFMESEYASYNDLVMTTFGGIALGETFHRLSEQILDDRTHGFNRVWRELTALVINPMGGFNRLASGQMFRTTSSVNHLRMPITGYFAFGSAGRTEGVSNQAARLNPAFELTLHYGHAFEKERHRKPFDYFTFRMWTSHGEVERNLTILARANLVGKNLRSGANQRHLIGISQQFDYIDLEIFKIGAMSFGPEWLGLYPLGNGFSLVTGVYAGGIIMGAGSNEYVESYQGRNYNFGWGFKGKADFQIRHPRFGFLYFDYNYFYIDSREGAPGHDRLHLTSVTYNIPVWHNLAVGAEYFNYYRNAHYDEYPDVKQTINGFRGLFTVMF
jgi:hypothetical protein